MCSLDFPAFSVISRVLQKVQREKVQEAIVVPKWPMQTWWPVLMQMLTDNNTNPPPPPPPQENTVPLVRRSLERQGISAEASRLIIQSWRSDNPSQYQTYYKKWEMFWRQRNINPLQATLQDGINFLAEIFGTGVRYSCTNTARSALSSLIVLSGSIQFGRHLLVTRFVKGVFEVRPALPRYKDKGCE